MLDDLRSSASTSYEPEEEELEQDVTTGGGPRRPNRKKKPFLGMAASQRFVLALMFLFLTCMGGILCLLVTESIYIP